MISVTLLLLAFGLILGSFFNVLIYRLPGDMGLEGERSVCPKCKSVLRPADLIPVLSWLLLRGRCRYCKEKISIQYPLVEIASAIFILIAFIKHGLGLEGALHYIFMSACLIITLTDIRTQIIPDKITIPLLVVFIIAAPIRNASPQPFELGLNIGHNLNSLVNALFAVIVCAGFLTILAELKNGGMGGGDIRFIAATAAYLGWYSTLLMLLLGSILGLAITLILAKGKIKKDRQIAFGPYLAAAGIIISNLPLDRIFSNIGM